MLSTKIVIMTYDFGRIGSNSVIYEHFHDIHQSLNCDIVSKNIETKIYLPYHIISSFMSTPSKLHKN